MNFIPGLVGGGAMGDDVSSRVPGLESHSRSVALASLPDGTVLTLHSVNTCYRILVVDGLAGRVLITGGRPFPDTTEAEIVGARHDDVFVAGSIVEGLPLELSTPRGPVLTSMIESIAVHKGITAVAF